MNRPIPHSRPTCGEEEADAVRRVVLSGQLAQGEQVERFEEEVAAFVGRRYGVAVSSGTAALHLALLALDVEESGEVLLPSYVCTALLHAVEAAGGRPIVADIERQTRNLSSVDVSRRCDQLSRAMIVPHMFGLPVSMDDLVQLGVPIIEDCAMAIGAARRGRKVGSFGELSICSFYATKMLSAAGEGGMLLTDSAELVAKVEELREYDGLSTDLLRFNYKMTEVAAAMGRVQLRRLSAFIERRREIAAQYDQAFDKLELERPVADPEHIYFRYLIHSAQEIDVLLERLQDNGVETRRPVYNPLHCELMAENADYPHTEAAFKADISLPIYPSQSDAGVAQVIEAVVRALGEV